MAWTTPKTWAPSAWQFSDANIYIRDNFISTRNFMATTQVFTDVASVTTTATPIASHLNVCPVAPDEVFLFLVTVYVHWDPFSATGNTLSMTLKDHASTVISPTTFHAQSLTAVRGTGVFIGWSSYTAGTNPGYSITASTDAGTCSVRCNAKVEIAPITT